MNIHGKFKIYPRGFLGAPLEPVLERKQRPTGRLQYDVSLLDPNDEKRIVANLPLEQAYQRLARNDPESKKFMFKEEALRLFMRAFGTENFAEWVVAQYTSPSFGETHQDFLDDTCHFLMCGQRRTSIQNWNAILDESETKLNTTVVSKNIAYFFGSDMLSEIARKNEPIYEVVARWMKHPSGIGDLLTTGHILFGIND